MTYDDSDLLDTYDDDWWDDEPSTPVKEEPDCHNSDCYDSGFITDRRGRERPCPACNPTWLQHRLWLLRWRIRDLLRRFRRPRWQRPGNYDEEPPF